MLKMWAEDPEKVTEMERWEEIGGAQFCGRKGESFPGWSDGTEISHQLSPERCLLDLATERLPACGQSNVLQWL